MWQERYKRQIAIPQIGLEGQRKIMEARALVLGAGGLGSPALLYLAAAGVGQITIVDCDNVSLSNLNRQVMYGDEDLGGSKAERAAKALRRLNPEARITVRDEMLTDENARSIVAGHDVALLCLDSTDARKTANKALVDAGIPFVDGAVERFYGTLFTVVPGLTPCYECLYAAKAHAPQTTPVLGAAAGIIGSMQAMAAIALLLRWKEPPVGTLICVDTVSCQNELIPVERDPQCPICGKTLPRAVS